MHVARTHILVRTPLRTFQLAMFSNLCLCWLSHGLLSKDKLKTDVFWSGDQQIENQWKPGELELEGADTRNPADGSASGSYGFLCEPGGPGFADGHSSVRRWKEKAGNKLHSWLCCEKSPAHNMDVTACTTPRTEKQRNMLVNSFTSLRSNCRRRKHAN